MYRLLHNVSCLFLILLLVSCASTEKQAEFAEPAPGEPGRYKYAAWRVNGYGEFAAINVLLKDVDKLIEIQSYDAASDKLERVLRIKPQYAPAWSRLSWLALQTGAPKSCVQMAKRSNSFARSDTDLQVLNWSFIGAASKELNDEDTYRKATQKMESLQAF